MKRLILIVLIVQLACAGFSQDNLQQHLAQAQNLSRQAWDYAQTTANLFSLYTGAADLEEIRFHSFEALTAMDSLEICAQKAIYQLSDATHLARGMKLAAEEQMARETEHDLNEALRSLSLSRNSLSLIFDELVEANLEIQLNQSIDYFTDTRKYLKQAERKFRQLLKTKR